MLRAVSTIYFESQALESARRDVYKLLRVRRLSSAAASSPHAQTVLTAETRRAEPPLPAPPAPPPPPGPGAPRRAWPLAGAALAVTASLGGAYLYRRLGERAPEPAPEPAPPPEPEPYPAAGELFPARVDYLLVGGGTASFAAMRALRAARPGASVLIVGDEPLPPYMRPPLSKEAWREPALAAADRGEPPSFRQWNGKRRPLLYEPPAFYVAVERVAERGGAACARGWTVARLDVVRHEAELRAPGRAPVVVAYGRCLVAPGLRARRLPALHAAREAGRSFVVRGVRDAARLARAVDAPDARRVVVVGGGPLASELVAALAERVGRDKLVTQVCREEAPLARVLPPYLAAEAARRLREAGAAVRGGDEVAEARLAADGAVLLRLASGAELAADVVVECVGGAADGALAAASGLELADGALAVNAELQARADVWAAGDAVSWHDVALGRRSLEHHDHAVHSGRRAGENMAAADGAQRPYDHQPMFWSDLGPELGFEAIGIVDSSLRTVGVFSAADVSDVSAPKSLTVEAHAAEAHAAEAHAVEAPDAETRGVEASDASSDAMSRRYSRGVVFYTRERRVVGVLLWNLFNRMHVARQVLAQGHFDDLLEVAKLFSLHEDD